MRPDPRPQRGPRPACSGGREHGFTLVELLVVLIIGVILGVIAVTGFRNNRTIGDKAKVVTTAQTYLAAIERFRADHGGQRPQFDNPEWWTSTSQAEVVKGPLRPKINASDASKHYISTVPEDALPRNGRILVVAAAGSAVANSSASDSSYATPSRTQYGKIVYVVPGSSASTFDKYRLDVYVAEKGAWKLRCYLGNWSGGATTKRCS